MLVDLDGTLMVTDEVSPRVADAVARVSELIPVSIATGRRVSDVAQAMTATGLGDHDAALEHLEAAVGNRDPGLVALRNSAVWDPLRNDPRFQAIVQNVRDLWRRSGGPRPGREAPTRSQVPRTPGVR